MKPYNFTKDQYDKATKIFTLPMGKIYPFTKHERENGGKLLPEVLLISPTGNEMIFKNPKNIAGTGLVYFNNSYQLKLIWL